MNQNEIPQGLCSKCHEGFMNCKCDTFHPTMMGLAVWFELLGILQWARNSESAADCMMMDELDGMIAIIKEEIRNKFQVSVE